MNERREGGWWRCGWWRYPGDQIRVVLAFTAAGLVVIALLPALIDLLPNGPPPPPNGGDPLKTMAEALKGIEESLSGARDLSITVKPDEDQTGLQNPSDGLTGIGKAIATGVEKISNETGAVSAGVEDIATGVKNVSVEAGTIATDMEKIVGNTDRVATGVENVSNKANAIASSVEGIATGVKNVSGKVDAIAAGVKDIADGMGGGIIVTGGLGGMTRPWACRKPDKCLGVVHFPHNWPPEPDSASDECAKRAWKELGSKEPIRKELDEIVSKLPSPPLPPPPSEVWVVGHASTLGTKDHNAGLSKRRAKFVACHLEKTLGWGNNVHFKTCAVGERGSADSLRHPDAWYRVVQVFAQKPSWCK